MKTSRRAKGAISRRFYRRRNDPGNYNFTPVAQRRTCPFAHSRLQQGHSPGSGFVLNSPLAHFPRTITTSARAMTQADLISPARFLASLPVNLGRVPRMLRGLYYTGIRNREKNLSLAWALERTSQLHPERPAVMDESRSLTYRQFNVWANRLAWALKADGVKHGSVVAVMLENRLEQLALLAALAKLGAVGALINTTQRGKVLTHS